MKDLMTRLLDAGYLREEMYHYRTDLYVYVTPLTTRVIERWCAENDFRMNWRCPVFTDQMTGRPMYDCAFAYHE